MTHDENAAFCDDALREMVCELSDVTVQTKQMCFLMTRDIAYSFTSDD
jgi:hypothetical protein